MQHFKGHFYKPPVAIRPMLCNHGGTNILRGAGLIYVGSEVLLGGEVLPMMNNTLIQC